MGNGRGAQEIGLTFCVSDHDPRQYYVMRGTSHAVGAMATHVDDIPGNGESGIMGKPSGYLIQRSRAPKMQETKFTDVGVELAQYPDFSVEITQDVPTDHPDLSPSSAELRHQRQCPLKPGNPRLVNAN